MVLAAGIMGVVGAFQDGTAMPMVTAFAICAIAAFILTQVTIRTTVTPVVGAPAE